MNQKLRPLTANERSFVDALLDDGVNKPRTIGEAYSLAFGPGFERQEASRLGSALAKTKRVRIEIEQRSSLKAIVTARKARASREAIERELWDIATKAERDADRVNALRSLQATLPKGELDSLSTLDRSALLDRVRTLLASQLGVEVPREAGCAQSEVLLPRDETPAERECESQVIEVVPSPPSF